MRVGRVMMGALYLLAGVGHLLATRVYAGIMPDYLPAHRALVPQTRRPAAWGIVALLVAVMPANVWMVQHPERWPAIPAWALWGRLPLQGVLIWWAWLYTRRDEA